MAYSRDLAVMDYRGGLFFGWLSWMTIMDYHWLEIALYREARL